MDWENLNWADIFRRLVLFAYKRRQLRGMPGSLAAAEDLAAEAIRRLLDPDYAEWDQNREPDVLRQLGSIVNGLLSNESRTVRARREQSLSDPSVLQSLEQLASAVNGIADTGDWRRALAMLEEKIADDQLIRKLLALEAEGITKAATQAIQLKVAIEVIYKARRRLVGHREVVRHALANDGMSGDALEHNQNGMR